MEPIINLEDEPGKTVGRRVVEDSFGYGMRLQSASRTIQQEQESGIRFIHKGVYRFNTHEEADEWLLTMMARAVATRSQS